MKVVVIGAAGLTGAAVASALVRLGHDVVGTSRRAAAMSLIAETGAAPAVVSLEDPQELGTLLRSADALVHVSGILSAQQLVAAGIAHLLRVIVISTAGIYSRTQSHRSAYLRNEEAIRRAAPNALFVRPTMIYGSPRDRNVHRVIAFASRWHVLPLPDGGKARIQPIHYQDLALATATLFETDAVGVVDAGGPTPVTTRSAALAIFAAMRHAALLVPVPVWILLPPVRLIDLVAPSRWSERIVRATEDRMVDNARLLALTSARLRSFEEGVTEEVALMRAEPG